MESAAAGPELERERHLGGRGVRIDRDVPLIDLEGAVEHAPAVAAEVCAAARNTGFFQVIGHGIEPAVIAEAFEHADRFFELSLAEKGSVAMPQGVNAGWEDRAQVRPSTGTPDQKETYQITPPAMDLHDLWPADGLLPGFRGAMEAFAAANHRVGMFLLGCIAPHLGFGPDFFSARHDPQSDGFQCTLRLLHYHAVDRARPGHWRAGAHTDYDCLTLLHQRSGEHGLEVCPGNERDSGAWTPVPAIDGVITCNIGDMLMRWSDDLLPSTLHRVRMPGPAESPAARRSMAYFCQADEDVIIEGPQRRHPPVTAAGHLQERIAANFAGSE